MELPEEVEKVYLGEVSILYNDNTIKIKSAEVKENGNTKILRIELEGAQTKYLTNSLISGINILIPTNIILRKDFVSKESSLKIKYSNEMNSNLDYIVEGRENKEIALNLKSVTEVANNEVNKQIVRAVFSESETITADALKISVKEEIGETEIDNGESVFEKQIIKYTVTAENTSEKDIQGIDISANIPEGLTYATINKGSYWDEKYEYVKDSNVKQYKLPITEVMQGEIKTSYFEVVVDDLENTDVEKTVQTQFITKINNKEYDNKIVSNNVKKADLSVNLVSYIGRAEKNQLCYASKTSR